MELYSIYYYSDEESEKETKVKISSLFSEYFEEARCYLGIEALQFDQSIGHKIYLHLGGEDDVKNMEVVDTEVLWELQYQVANRINEL